MNDKKEVVIRNGREVATSDSATFFRNGQSVSAVPNTRGVTGQLEQPEQPAKEYLEKLNDDGRLFMSEYPQIIWQNEDGQENFSVITTWLKAKGVGGTYPNLLIALNNIYRELIFNPSTIGLTIYMDRITGVEAERIMPAVHFDTLLKPYRRVKQDDLLSAAEHKAAHPNAWAGVTAHD
jgi:hypothetical protein